MLKFLKVIRMRALMPPNSKPNENEDEFLINNLSEIDLHAILEALHDLNRIPL